MSKRISLTQDKYAVVDDSDYEWLSQWKWIYQKRDNYAAHWNPETQTSICMHRIILNPPDHLQVDHIDRDGLNNQRSNLRVANQTQQNANRGLSKNNKTGYKGVRYVKAKRKYRAEIGVNKKSIHLGYFDDPREAAMAYNEAALKYFGEYARLNNVLRLFV